MNLRFLAGIRQLGPWREKVSRGRLCQERVRIVRWQSPRRAPWCAEDRGKWRAVQIWPFSAQQASCHHLKLLSTVRLFAVLSNRPFGSLLWLIFLQPLLKHRVTVWSRQSFFPCSCLSDDFKVESESESESESFVRFWGKMYNKTFHAEHRAIQRDNGDTESSSFTFLFFLGDVVNLFFVLPLIYVLFRKSANTFFSSPPGFVNAPVTKSVIILTIVSSLWAIFMGQAHSLSWQSWRFGLGTFFLRLVTYQLYFSSFWSTLCGCLLLYQFRQFERQWGAGKVSSICVLETLQSVLEWRVSPDCGNVSP